MTGAAPAARPKPWGEALASFFTFLALGPPIGALVFAFGIFFVPSVTGIPQAEGTGIPEYLMSAFWISLFAMPFSYIVGGIQAAATGLAFAVYGWFRNRPPWWFAALTAAGVSLGSFSAGMAEADGTGIVFLFVHIVPTLLCWLIIRSYWRTPA